MGMLLVVLSTLQGTAPKCKPNQPIYVLKKYSQLHVLNSLLEIKTFFSLLPDHHPKEDLSIFPAFVTDQTFL